jgi:FixJ family two-component response regulator
VICTGALPAGNRSFCFGNRKLSKPKIAIVDDDEMLREAMEFFIGSLGYEPDPFASAESYLTSGRMAEAACLITDVRMPGMTGFELQKRLVAAGYRIPVIFITGLTEEPVRQAAIAAGAIAFLKKPLDLECLEQCLKQAIKGQAGDS